MCSRAWLSQVAELRTHGDLQTRRVGLYAWRGPPRRKPDEDHEERWELECDRGIEFKLASSSES